MSLLQDARLKKVVWKDLTRLSLRQRFIENNITLPWLLLSCGLAYFHYYLLALPFSFLFFLTGLRQVHNGFHYTLGIGKRYTGFTLYMNSLLMITSMHAVKFNHLRHHKYCLKEGDVEGNCAKMKPVRALLYGPAFIYRLHATALRMGSPAIRRAVAGELFTAFFAVWTVHHDCDEEVFARSLHKRWKNRLTYNMFYHLEYHLFPGVPTIRLPELSARIREKLPDVTIKEVF
ncbi:MAG: fatty acid desaturase [Bacteroidetes bacterium]|nr:fatty acid desaturase [Bacteroidota bacterium]